MGKIKFRHFIVAVIILSGLTACTLPGFSTPTPFSFPTPDKTMTALFEPTQAAPATSAATASEVEDQKTATEAVPSETPEVEETEVPPTKTGEPTKTIDPTVSYVGPSIRSGPSIRAYYMATKPTIDGDLSDWAPPIQKVINHVIYGAANHSGDLDSSGTVVVGWNEDYLFLGLGDSIEIVFDRYVSNDYYLQAMTSDDYQIGISPGKGGICYISTGKVASMPLITTGPPEAYKWFPKTEAGVVSGIKIAAKEGGEGYQVEMKIPWSVLGVTNPSKGDHFGFAISINDNDKAGTLNQQTVVSNVPGRFYSDPTTWGDLYLK
jgi:hypothetical protein